MELSGEKSELLKLHRADYGTAEEAAVLEVLRSGWLTKGPRTREFEAAFARRVAAPYTLGVNSCTAGLHLAMLAGNIGPGDEVIVPAMTFAASVNVVVHCGATPVFADVLEETHNIDPDHAASLVTPKTKAIVAVHFAGIPCEMDSLAKLADEHGLFIVEDCAHAIEAEYRGKPVGVGGCPATRFAAYSFYATKNLICGEGGMLACRDETDLERATVLGLHGMSANAWKRYSGEGFSLYDIIEPGYKYNMFDLQAALGLVQLEKLDANWQRRRERVEQYDALIAGIEGVEPLRYAAHVKPAHHLYMVKLSDELLQKLDTGESPEMPHASPGRDRVITGLRRRGVEAYLHYICLTETRLYRERFGTSGSQSPVAASLARRSITLPLFPSMTAEETERVVSAINIVLG